MAIQKRTGTSGAHYQVKLRGSDGCWVSETFPTMGEARAREAELKHQLNSGHLVSAHAKRVTLSQYFVEWFEQSKTGRVSPGWRRDQERNFRGYVEPILGGIPLARLTPAQISMVFVRMTEMGRASQTQLHVYNLMHKMLGDAVEMFRLLQLNPVSKRLRPKLITREVKYLTFVEAVRLLTHVKDKPYETAIALGLLAGLRVGETQALKWEDVDFARRTMLIKSTYVRKEGVFREHPKGRAWRRVPMTQEIETLLRERSNVQQPTPGDYVAAESAEPYVDYQRFFNALQRYCREAAVTVIGTHGLRHSASEIYMEHGGSRDDLRVLYRHSSGAVTDTYVHDNGSRLEKVARKVNLRVIKGAGEQQCSQNVPKQQENEVQSG